MSNNQPRDQTKRVLALLYKIVVPVLTLIKLIKDIIAKGR